MMAYAAEPILTVFVPKVTLALFVQITFALAASQRLMLEISHL